MTSDFNLYTKIEILPENLKKQVADYIDLLLKKYSKPNTTIEAGFGSAKGKIKMADDFDAPLDEFKDYMW